MKMRDFINIVEAIADYGVYWYNPSTRTVEAFNGEHVDRVLKKLDKFGISSVEIDDVKKRCGYYSDDGIRNHCASEIRWLALSKGWVRISARSWGLRKEIPTAEALNVDLLRKAVQWMLKNGIIADSVRIEIAVEPKEMPEAIDGVYSFPQPWNAILQDKEIDVFARTGKLPSDQAA